MRAYFVPAPWSRPVAEVAERLDVEPELGLEADEAARRLSVVGENRLEESRQEAWWRILGRQLKSLIVGLLGVAAIASFVFGDTVEAGAIVAVLVINTALGFFAEFRAIRSMESLRQLGSETTRVRRAGGDELIPAALVVPGDIVLLEAGDRISADLRLFEAAQLEADESVLTGESLPLAKSVDPVDVDAELHARANMLFKGTTVTRGAGAGVTVATGMASELGRIAALTAAAGEEVTPLERSLAQLGRRLIAATLVVAAGATLAGIVAGRETLLMVQTGLALAVAAIPEGLPIVATIALARGMWRMARRNALINRLSAVEALGATTVILTDKTGTLTENRLAVARVVTDRGAYEVDLSGPSSAEFRLGGEAIEATAAPLLNKALRISALCNDASVTRDGGRLQAVGDPLESALLVAALAAGIDRSELLALHPEERQEAFDAETRMMATFHRINEHLEVAVKGAADALLERADAMLGSSGKRSLGEAERDRWERAEAELAAQGLRVIGVATKRATSIDDDPYERLTFVGLIGFLDPPRADVAAALAACRNAGIRVVMVTGDQAATARFIAEAVGLVADGDGEVVVGRDIPKPGVMSTQRRRELLAAPIFARVNPEHKLDLIALHQDAGGIVAMTGDGVNDAPALKKADIGIAMGLRGTAVAQEASDIVLTDDAFASIVAAVRHGRVVFANIRKFVVYLMSCNVSEIFIVTAAVAVDVPLPLLPLQILFLNLVTDVFPALALAFGEGDNDVMVRPPRPRDEPLVGRREWAWIAAYGLVITGSVLTALMLARVWLGLNEQQAVTVSFATLAMAQLWHVFNLRERGSSVLRNDIVRNPWVWAALALCVGLIVAAVHLPGLSTVLRTSDPGIVGWGVILGMSFVPWAVGQMWASLAGRWKTPGTLGSFSAPC